MVRGSIPLGIGLIFIALGVFVFGIAKPVPKHPSSGGVAAAVLLLIGVVFLVCHFSIIWLNRPAWMIPPHMRGSSNATARVASKGR